MPVTFAVDEDAEPATAPLVTRPLGVAGALCVGGDANRRVVDLRAQENDAYEAATAHPLIGAVSLAFRQHRPLVLTPDAIWLTIAQGVAQHVRDNAVELRPRMVRHQGRKLLEVGVASTPTTADAWTAVVAQLRDALAAEVGEGRARLFECTFSTSTDTDLVASRVVMFDAYSPYFDFGVRCICGIPTVTVTGTPADWRAIRERVAVVAELGLEAWAARLGPIIDEFIATAEGRPNVALWKRIYNARDVYGGPKITGWITRLYPKILQNGARVDNPMLAYAMDEPQRLEAKLPPGLELDPDNMMYEGFIPGVSLSAFPTTLSRVSVRVAADRVSRVALVGGLTDIAVGERGLEPISGWHLEPAEIELAEVCGVIRHHHRAEPGPAPRADRAPLEQLARLWTEIASATLFEGDRTWRIGGPAELRWIDPHAVKHQRLFALGDLPGGKSLCVIDLGHRGPPRWFVCTLAPSTRDKRYALAMVEPLDEVVTYGSSLAVILDTALATGGDISELADATLARFI